MKDGYDLVDIYCGTALPPLLVSNSNIVKIRFHTDHTEEGEGFNATFRQVAGKMIQ